MIQDGGFSWLASYPKSGNTWMRCLLEAYRTNGHLDINDIRVSIGDSGRIIHQAVSALPIHKLTEGEVYLLRPAALMTLLCMSKRPRLVKTHFANRQVECMPPFIPGLWTAKAVYIVRDPRSVALSMARHFGMSHERAATAMSAEGFTLGTLKEDDDQCPIFVGPWSLHVNSWCNETKFPVLLLKYEDMVDDIERILKGVVEFLWDDYDEARGKRAIKAAKLSRLQKAEAQDGFSEVSAKAERFFTAGGSRWEDELGARWARQIEKEHGKVMKRWGYL